MATLGLVTMDFANLRFQFRQGTIDHLWQGESGLESQSICYKSLRRMSDTKAVVKCYYLQLVGELKNTHDVLQEDVANLLSEFDDVFQALWRLPPTQHTDHAIHLELSSKPVNVRHYRYPHFQKGEAKHQVQQLLDSQLIWKSTNPFSSPVLLVKKKDSTWRFCVDYWALNSITMKDKFPIPTAEELFDELGTAWFFSKLDLLAAYHQIRVKVDDVSKTAF
ncbi:hypothetical protein GQ457_01G018830 [Hibiscus cannabinus]